MAGSKPTFVEKPDSKKSGPAGLGRQTTKTKKLPRAKEKEVMVMQMTDGRHHPDSIKLKKTKKFTNSDGNIEFTNFSKGGSVKKKKSSGKAIRGKGCEIR